MRNRENILVLDVETAGDLDNPLVYDLGIAVVQRTTGLILESHSIVIDEVFYGMPDAMDSAYYSRKLPQYHRGIVRGEYRVLSIWQAWRLVRDLLAEYDIERVYAYNAMFDRRALNYTFQTLTDRGRYFFPRVRWCCIWHMACSTLFTQKRYQRWATRHGLVSPAGNLRTSAEAAYGYIINDPDYIEPHTGLADVEIEIAILHHILRQKKRLTETPSRWCWKIPQRKDAA